MGSYLLNHLDDEVEFGGSPSHSRAQLEMWLNLTFYFPERTEPPAPPLARDGFKVEDQMGKHIIRAPRGV